MAEMISAVSRQTTIPALLGETARRSPGSPALSRYVSGRFVSLSYGQLFAAAGRMAERLCAQGAAPERRVAIAVTDRFEWGVSYLGVLFSGATAVPIDLQLTPPEINGILSDADVSLVIHDGRIDLGDWRSRSEVIGLDQTLPDLSPSAPGGPFRVPELDPESLASIIFTSGTTGQTKGVMLTHANLVADVLGIQAMGLCFSSDTLLSILPIHHAFECTAGFLYPLSIGAHVAYARSLKSNEILADMNATQATVILAVPLLFENIVNSIKRHVHDAPLWRQRLFSLLMSTSRMGRRLGWRSAGRVVLASVRRKAGLSSLRILVSGGAALPPSVAEFCDIIGLPLIQGYGLTETSPVVSVNRPGRHRYDTVGPPIPNVQVKIVDPRPDGIGEIAVAGPIVMKGYWKRPDDTAKVLRDGWLLTGDLGSIDAGGHVHICGRSKNVIITGAGKNVYPEEVEAVLGNQPEISESVVYGKSRPGKIGEIVAAVVVPDPDWFASAQPGVWDHDDALRSVLVEAVHKACEDLAPFKRIVDIEIRREPLEKTTTRKIRRYLVIQPRHDYKL